MMDKLLEQICPLIPQDLFHDGSVLLPVYENPIDHECNIKYAVASLLEKHGQVWTEVFFGGRADVLFELNREDRVLIEVKKTIHDMALLSKNRKSLLRYLDLNIVNLFYLLCFDPMVAL